MNRWRYIADDGVSGSFGLAADEYLMGGYGEAAEPKPPTLRLYTYRPTCVLVGRFQNVAAEVSDSLRLCFGGDIQSSQVVTQAGMGGLQVELNRRPTGGGTIIMGDGQLGVALITSTHYPETPQHPREVLETYAGGVMEGLRRLGIEGARLRSRNDIEVGGRKIAGLGLYSDEQGALLFHTSIMVDFDIRLMVSLLNIPVEKLRDKGVTTLEERHTTVQRELGRPVSISEAREKVKEGFQAAFGMEFSPQPFTEDEISEISTLERGKYLTREWIYQEAAVPDLAGSSLKKTRAGLIRVQVALTGEVIKSALITGDFFATPRTINNIEARLRWAPADRESIRQAIEDELSSPGSYILDLEPDMLARCIMAAVSDARAEKVGAA
jgi:lipoate-protein ligase A